MERSSGSTKKGCGMQRSIHSPEQNIRLGDNTQHSRGCRSSHQCCHSKGVKALRPDLPGCTVGTAACRSRRTPCTLCR